MLESVVLSSVEAPNFHLDIWSQCHSVAPTSSSRTSADGRSDWVSMILEYSIHLSAALKASLSGNTMGLVVGQILTSWR